MVEFNDGEDITVSIYPTGAPRDNQGHLADPQGDDDHDDHGFHHGGVCGGFLSHRRLYNFDSDQDGPGVG
jgi:hypothetical protein